MLDLFKFCSAKILCLHFKDVTSDLTKRVDSCIDLASEGKSVVQDKELLNTFASEMFDLTPDEIRILDYANGLAHCRRSVTLDDQEQSDLMICLVFGACNKK